MRERRQRTTYSERPSTVTSCETSGMDSPPTTSVPSAALPFHCRSTLQSKIVSSL